MDWNGNISDKTYKISEIAKTPQKHKKRILVFVALALAILIVLTLIMLSQRLPSFESSLEYHSYHLEGNKYVRQHTESDGSRTIMYSNTYDKSNNQLIIRRTSSIHFSSLDMVTIDTYSYIIDIKTGVYEATYKLQSLPPTQVYEEEAAGNFYNNTGGLTTHASLRDFIMTSNLHLKSLIDESWIPIFLYKFPYL